MNVHTHAQALALRLLICATGFALGASLGRFTDVSKHDLTRALVPRAPVYVRAQALRASVRYTGKPSSSARTSRLLRAP